MGSEQPAIITEFLPGINVPAGTRVCMEVAYLFLAQFIAAYCSDVGFLPLGFALVF